LCMTEKEPLAGSLPAGLDEYVKETVPQLAERFGVEPKTVRHLIHFYGSRAEKILHYTGDDPRLAEQISPESMDIYAQVLYGIREEGAKTISDVLLRRIHTGITASRGEPQARKIAGIVAGELGWNPAEQDHWIEKFKEDLMKEKRF